MSAGLVIRESEPADLASIEALYPTAFPDEDLLPLVRDLLRTPASVLSLVARIDRSLSGHIVFTRCGIADTTAGAALLGPLGVAPDVQKKGIGSALVQVGLQKMEETGVAHVYVLGDPAYYHRFGFLPEAHVAPPYPLPEAWREAWQSLSLGNAEPPGQGALSVPEPWRQAALWQPAADQA